MPELAATILLLFSLLLIKHMFADYFLQTARMIAGRGTYLHMGRAQHAAIHALLSVPCFLVIGVGLPFVLILVAIEWVVHFHIDWAKARYSDARALHPGQAHFWKAFGVDQTLHGLTYVAMVWAWLYYTTPYAI
ncbi:MAG: DUF3307 domain-containing protein [Rhodobacteraceae bacterium]|nr:DUF3307 domain-containing protein [Paracoccaceae bacterium]